MSDKHSNEHKSNSKLDVQDPFMIITVIFMTRRLPLHEWKKKK